MTHHEKLAEIVREHREFQSEMAAARAAYPAIIELREKLDARIDECMNMLGNLLQRYEQITDLVSELVEGEEWALGLDNESWHDESWNEESD